MAWNPLALSLIGQLGLGTVTASTVQLGLGLAAGFGATDGALLIFGIGLVWVTRAQTEPVPVLKPAIAGTPA
jgi:hypothetical protein